MSRIAWSLPLCLTALALAACDSEPPLLTLDITTGHETDAFSRDPAVVRVDVAGYAPEGDIAIGASSAPGGSFELGEVELDRLLWFDVVGLDGTGSVRARGRSLGVVLGALESDVLPVFAQRTGEWARPPGALDHTHVGGIAGVLVERYLMLAGGIATSADGAELEGSTPTFYDFLSLGGATSQPLGRTPKSMVVRGTAALLIDDEGANWVDFDLGTSDEMSPPPGLPSFAAVAGGQAVAGSGGLHFVVGATRTDQPSDAVLVIDSAGQLEVAWLSEPRQGAAAAWLEPVGLVIAGGSDTAPGIEVLAPGNTSTATRPFEPDAVRGASGLAHGDGTQLLLLGGHDQETPAPLRKLDATCFDQCGAQTIDDVVFDTPLEKCQAFFYASDLVAVIGQDARAAEPSAGETRAYSVDLVGQIQTALPLREPRYGATATAAPHGMLTVLGGRLEDGSGAMTVEMLFAE